MNGWPPGTTWVEISASLDVRICLSGPAGCRKKWKSHQRPRVDQMGVIHYDGLATRAVMKGLYHYLKLVALAKNRPFRDEPAWLRLYHQSTWASHAYITLFHRRLPWSRTFTDRMTVKKLSQSANVVLGNYPVIEAWVYYKPVARRVTMEQVKGGALRGRRGRSISFQREHLSALR